MVNNSCYLLNIYHMLTTGMLRLSSAMINTFYLFIIVFRLSLEPFVCISLINQNIYIPMVNIDLGWILLLRSRNIIVPISVAYLNTISIWESYLDIWPIISFFVKNNVYAFYYFKLCIISYAEFSLFSLSLIYLCEAVMTLLWVLIIIFSK